MTYGELPGEELGYTLYPPSRHSDPGCPRVDIRICDTPSEQHFDPYRLTISVYAGLRGIDNLLIRHPWHGETHFHVVPGPMHLESHTGKSLEAFTFGGELEIQESPDCTLLVLKSSAPILFNYVTHSLGKLLAEEVEILLAERHAARGADDDLFDHHLESVDPRRLYLSCLHTLRLRFKKMPILDSDLSPRFLHMIKDESCAMEKELGYSSGDGPDLDELL